jgi:hypothetical protein
MSETSRCAKCGGPLAEEGAPGGRCPRCLPSEADFQRTMTVAPAAASAHPSSAEQRRPDTIGRYRIVRLIGEGGEARQVGRVAAASQVKSRSAVEETGSRVNRRPWLGSSLGQVASLLAGLASETRRRGESARQDYGRGFPNASGRNRSSATPIRRRVSGSRDKDDEHAR